MGFDYFYGCRVKGSLAPGCARPGPGAVTPFAVLREGA
jgi:hypothetical protein